MAKIGIHTTPLILKEYGRNIQKLVNYIMKIEDKEERTQAAYALVDLMKQVNPGLKETNENNHKLWDDLYIMSNFKLDVDGPFPMPEEDILTKRPKKMDYNVHELRFKHYGHNIELMIEKAKEMEDEEEKEAATIYIGKLMKSFYAIWNKDNIDDVVIIDNIKELSKHQLDLDLDKVRQNNLFDTTYKDKSRSSKGKRSYSGRKRKS